VSHASPRTKRPVLLLLVYGAVLVIVGITATSQAGVVSDRFKTTALEAVIESDTAAVRGFVNRDLLASDLTPGRTSPDRVAAIERALATLVTRGGIVHAEVRLPDGTILASNLAGMAGTHVDSDAAFLAAANGNGGAAFLPVGQAGDGSAADLAATVEGDTVLREALPLTLADGRVAATVGLWREAGPILAQLDGVRREIVVLTLTAAFIVSLLLTIIFRTAQARLTRQTDALVEATRRDPLTGLLNHGTLVSTLVERIETARVTHAVFGIALADIDNFRALNDTHGHDVGDDALLQVVESLEQLRRPGSVIGRYGPDEFLVIVGAADAASLEADMGRLRAALAEIEIVVAGAEPLPLTISAGIATYPTHADAATSLLSAAATAVGVAKAGGGNAVRVADADPESAVGAATFDVFQGLVLAINTKDRYTKRHSEDVARYALFLAGRVGLDPGFLETLRVAGLLHDVGKIGIPDPILRKPGRLTAEEFGILKQHVALGDSIVRDLPEIDLIRAGIRHHHERWDGKGYLGGLAGEVIPLVARILAVADTFSAMTTSRPYRKSLSVTEAMRRLGDAAGSQLDERLVGAFITGMETAPDAPIPGSEPAGLLWTPATRTA
jgi:diguanylate cyclase (GGDEF)-like protein